MKDFLQGLKKGTGSGEENSAAYTWFGVKKELLIRLALAVILFIVGLIAAKSVNISLILMVVSFLVCGYDVLIRAAVRIARERFFGEEMLVVIAAILAFTINAGYEGTAVMIIYQAGFVLRAYALELTRGSLRDKVEPYPGDITVLRGDESVQIAPEKIQPDDILLIRQGERFPVDCEVTAGESAVELSTILGRSRQKDAAPGDRIPAGAQNLREELHVRAVGRMADSVLSRALEMTSDEDTIQSSTEDAIDRYARVFAPFALGFSVLIALVLMIFSNASTEQAIHRALVLLIVACPAALLVPIPFTYLSGLYRSLQKGVLVKGAAVLDSIARTGVVIFDKNDLIAAGQYRVSAVKSDRMDPNVLLKVAAHAAYGSGRDQALTVVNAYDGIIDNSLIERFEEFDDGIAAVVEGVIITMGSQEFMQRLGVALPEEPGFDPLVIYMALNGRYAGYIQLSETPRGDIRGCVSAIESTGSDCIVLSSDNAENTRNITSAAGIREFYPQCMPLDRLEKIQEIKERFPVNSVLYVGHGTTDSSSLEAADIGVCVNGIESEAAFQGGSVVIMDNTAEPLAEAVEAARVTRRTVRQTVAAIVLVKLLLFILSLFGITYQLWFAAMVDVVIGVAGILFSTRVWNDK